MSIFTETYIDPRIFTRLLSTDRAQAELWTESLHNNNFQLLCVISPVMYTKSKFSQLFPIHCPYLVLGTFTLKSRFFSQNDPVFHLRDLPTTTVEFACKNFGRLILGNFYVISDKFRTNISDAAETLLKSTYADKTQIRLKRHQ